MGKNTTSDARLIGMVEGKPAGCAGEGSGPCASAGAAVALLEQALGFIGSIDDESYGRASTMLPGGTIGKHFRHVVDHFSAALAPLRPGVEPGSVIDYDHRERNVPMETCRETALKEIRGVIEELRRAGEAESAAGVRVRLMLTSGGEEGEFSSTLGRELAFASHHAVHHHAMIGAIAGEFGIRAPEGFGKAPSTLHFERVVSGRCGR